MQIIALAKFWTLTIIAATIPCITRIVSNKAKILIQTSREIMQVKDSRHQQIDASNKPGLCI